MGSGAVVARDVGRTRILEDTFRPNPVQARFFQACNRPFEQVQEVLFDGSIRLGKTYAACKVITAWAMRWPGTYVISRFSYPELEDSTKKVFLYGDGDLPAACPMELWRGGNERAMNQQYNRLHLANGSIILFRALEEKERGKIRNITAAGWFIDQAEELDGPDVSDFYMEIKGRCSAKIGPKKVLLVANPGPTTHFLYRRFINPVARHPKTARVHGTVLDNAMNLHPDYVQMLLDSEHTDPAYFSRMVMGEWGAFGGKRFPMWDERLHKVDRVFDIPYDWTVYEGADFGWSHPTVWLWGAVDYDARWWIVAEHAASETEVPEHVRRIREIRRNQDEYGDPILPFRGDLHPSVTWADPAGWAKRGETDPPAVQFMQRGVALARANNERLGGWSRIAMMLNEKLHDGYPRLRVFPTCPLLLEQLPNLKVKPGTDDVDKGAGNDDAPDALRYMLKSHASRPDEQERAEWRDRRAHSASVIRNRLKVYADRDNPRKLIVT